MADAIGVDGIHSVSGVCDLCGELCDPSNDELNVLSCTFSECVGYVYHQDCLEKYLKSIRLERNRKTGFKCPRGCGKGTKFKDGCPGRIDKSHPIHPRNDEGRKRKKSKLPEPVAVPRITAKVQKPKAPETPCKVKLVPELKEAPVKAKAKPLVAAAAPPRVEDPQARLRALAAAAKSEIAQVKVAPIIKEKASESLQVREVSSLQAPAVNAWGKQPLLSKPIASTSTMAEAIKAQKPEQRPAPPPPPPPPAAHNFPALPSTSSALSPPGPATTQQCWADVPRLFQPPPPPPAMQQQQQQEQQRQQSQQVDQEEPHDMSIGNGIVPVGMEYTADEVDGKPSKAQRKNMKRAEKKKRAAAMESTSTTSFASAPSLGSSEQETVAQAESDTLIYNLCVEAIVAHKVIFHIEQLVKIGFPEWQCIAAVQRYGSNLEAAVSWLLDCDSISPSCILNANADVCPEIDVADELQQLHHLQSASLKGVHYVWTQAVECCGDLDKLTDLLIHNGELGVACKLDSSGLELGPSSVSSYSQANGTDEYEVHLLSNGDTQPEYIDLFGVHSGTLSPASTPATTNVWTSSGTMSKPASYHSEGESFNLHGMMSKLSMADDVTNGVLKPSHGYDVPLGVQAMHAWKPQADPVLGAAHFVHDVAHYNRILGIKDQLPDTRTQNFSLFAHSDDLRSNLSHSGIPAAHKESRLFSGAYGMCPGDICHGAEVGMFPQGVSSVSEHGLCNDDHDVDGLVATLLCR